MGRSKAAGFTIIETTLFLAVSGLLIIGMVAGAGASLNAQRYQDATQSFKSLLQAQYSDLTNVQNGRDKDWDCTGNQTTGPGTGVYRGQANCVIVGKYVRIDASDISVYTVLATQTSTLPPTGGTDIDSLRTNYSFSASKAETDKIKMDWGTEIAWAKDGSIVDGRAIRTPRTIGIFFVRSPDSGLMYTFTSDFIPAEDAISSTTFSSMLVAGGTTNGQAARTLCIQSSGLAASGDRAVYISAYAAGASAIEIRSNSLAGVTSQC